MLLIERKWCNEIKRDLRKAGASLAKVFRKDLTEEVTAEQNADDKKDGVTKEQRPFHAEGPARAKALSR